MKEQEDEISISERQKKLIEQRKIGRERTQKYRAKKNASNKSMIGQENVSRTIQKSYSSSAALGKATSKVRKALPISPTKRHVVLSKVLREIGQSQQLNVVESDAKGQTPIRNIELLANIRTFYDRDDISRASPNEKDVKKYLCENGTKVMLPARHMLHTIKEAAALFNSEMSAMGKGIYAAIWLCKYFFQ